MLAHPGAATDHPGAATDQGRDRALADFANAAPGSPERRAARDDILAAFLPLVHFVAFQFGVDRNERADLVQVGAIGLIRALDRFDPAQGTRFSTYAMPCIAGEIRHYLRDDSACVHVPRGIRERRQRVTAATAELGNHLGREPQVTEIARSTGLSPAQVDEAIASSFARRPAPLDDDGQSLVESAVRDLHWATDPALARVETQQTLRGLLGVLTPAARRVIDLYFFAGLSQAQIAADLGIAQVTVSRTLQASLRRMRAAAARD